uniref:Putative secreted protein n=1 Tax=Rhipicephalus microplus TaxID=6941 RepID=A0A6M2DBE6_RHIMP
MLWWAAAWKAVSRARVSISLHLIQDARAKDRLPQSSPRSVDITTAALISLCRSQKWHIYISLHSHVS